MMPILIKLQWHDHAVRGLGPTVPVPIPIVVFYLHSIIWMVEQMDRWMDGWLVGCAWRRVMALGHALIAWSRLCRHRRQP